MEELKKLSCNKPHISLVEKILFLLLVFFLNPVIGILLTTYLCLKNNSYSYCICLIILICLYMGALNSTKIPDGDEPGYIEMFLGVPKNGLMGTMAFWNDDGSIKEPTYGLLVYLLYYFTFGYKFLFIAIITFLIYFPLLYSIYLNGIRSKLPVYMAVSGIFVISFFTQYFGLTAHLIRQCLAASLFIYSLTFRGSSMLKFILVSLLSITVHMSMVTLFLFALIPKIYQKLSFKLLIILSVVSVSFTTFFPSVANYLLGMINIPGDMGVALTRAASAEGAMDVAGDVDQRIINIVTIPMLTICFYSVFKKKDLVEPVFENLCIICCLFVLSLAFSPLLQYRYSANLYCFFPFVFIGVFDKKTTLSKGYCLFISLFFFFRFYILFNQKAWHYTSTLDAIFSPFLFLLNF